MVRPLLRIPHISDNFRLCRRASTKSSDFHYCLNSIKKHDHENFLCTLVLPSRLRYAGIVLRAFNVEIATVQDQVSELTIGQMRFQFWENSIDQIYEGVVPQHPICTELAKVIDRNNASTKYYLRKLISARRDYLLSARFATLQKAEEYGEAVNAPVYNILQEIQGIKNIDADHAAAHLGRAQGLTNLLRSTKYNAQKNLVSIPEEILVRFKVSEEDILRNKVTKDVKDVFFEIADTAYAHIEAVNRIQKKLDKVCRRIYLPIVALESYLKRLQSVHFDVFHPKLQKKNDLLPLKLFWRKLFL